MLDSGYALDPLRFPRRKTVRLKDHDYTNGTYFLTLCVYQRRPLLSIMANGQAHPTRIGRIVEQEWLRTANLRPGVVLDAFVVMPDHLHGIVTLAGPGSAAGLRPDVALADLVRADLARADLARADLARADLMRAALMRADLVRADLVRADLVRADLVRADLVRADLVRAHAVRPYGSSLARLVAGFKSSCTRQYRAFTGHEQGRLWQRGF